MNCKLRKRLDITANIGMAVFGLLGIILISLKNPWGFVAGLFSQPFFFTCSILHRQWGLFVVNPVRNSSGELFLTGLILLILLAG